MNESCLSVIELEFVSTNMGLDFSVPFKPITCLVKSSSEFADQLARNSTSLQHLAYQDRAICGSLFRYFRIKLSRSTDRHNPHIRMRHDLEKNGLVFDWENASTWAILLVNPLQPGEKQKSNKVKLREVAQRRSGSIKKLKIIIRESTRK